MSLTFDNKIEWEGSFVSIGDITYQKEVKLTGKENKNPINDYFSGGALFQGTKEFSDILEMTKIKFMCENVDAFKKDITVSGPAVGTIKNCQDIQALKIEEGTEARILRCKVKKDLNLKDVKGELIEIETLENTSIDTCGLIFRDYLANKDLSIKDSYVDSSLLTVTKATDVENSFINLDTFTTETLTLKDTKLKGQEVSVLKSFTETENSIAGILNLGAESIELTESKLYGSNFEVTDGVKLTTSLLDVDTLSSTSIESTDSFIKGSVFAISDQINLDNSTFLVSKVYTEAFDLTQSSVLGQKMSVGGNTSLDGSSSLVGLVYSGDSVTSTGSLFLTSATTDLTISDQGFIGIGVSGSSNFSSLQGGVDSLAVPRINSRTRDDLILRAEKSGFFVTDEDLLLQSEANIFLEAEVDIVSESQGDTLIESIGSTFVVATMNVICDAGQNYSAKSASIASVVSGQGLLCEAGGTMNLIAGGDQLLKGSQVYVKSGGIPQFTPPDYCTADGCSKPVWKVGGADKSVNQPIAMQPTGDPPELPD